MFTRIKEENCLDNLHLEKGVLGNSTVSPCTAWQGQQGLPALLTKEVFGQPVSLSPVRIFLFLVY